MTNYSIANTLVSVARNNGGITLGLHDNVMPDDGFMVGGVVPTLIVPLDNERHYESVRMVYEWLDSLEGEFDYVGSWADGTRIYIDISECVTSEWDALTLAHARNEIAIWDIANGSEIRTPEFV